MSLTFSRVPEASPVTSAVAPPLMVKAAEELSLMAPLANCSVALTATAVLRSATLSSSLSSAERTATPRVVVPEIPMVAPLWEVISRLPSAFFLAVRPEPLELIALMAWS
ncbi:hypothetical protein D9M70_626130 [compost metagenome]